MPRLEPDRLLPEIPNSPEADEDEREHETEAPVPPDVPTSDRTVHNTVHQRRIIT